MISRFEAKARFLGGALCAFAISPILCASGLSVEQGARGSGTAHAGASATASDATTVFYNPAGMSVLKGNQATVSILNIKLKAKYEDSGTSSDALGSKLTGGDGGDIGTSATIPNIYYVHHMAPFSLGFGVSAPYGLGVKYDEGWKGRFSATEASISVLEIGPAVSYQVDDKLSIGLSVGYQMLKNKVSAKINNFVACFGGAMASGASQEVAGAACASQQGVEGKVTLDGTSSAMAFGLGAIYKLDAETNIGLSYRSGASHKVKGTAKFEQTQFFNAQGLFNDGDIKSTMELPARTSLAIAHESGKYGIMADITRVSWSSFDKLEYTYADKTPASKFDLQWNDVTRFALGLSYKVVPEVPVRIGLALDPTPVDGESRRYPALPDTNRKVLGLGAGYETNVYRVNLGITFVKLEDGDSDTTTATKENIKGKYNSASITTVGVQFDYIL